MPIIIVDIHTARTGTIHPLEMFGDPVSNPKGWSIHELQSVSEQIVDCPHSTPKWAKHGVVCIRTSNLTEGGWSWGDTRYVTQDDYVSRSSRSKVLPGDIILSREGTVGIAAIVPQGLQLCMGQRLVQVRPNKSTINSPYLLQLLLWQLAPEQLGRLMRGSTSKHLNVKDLRKMPLPLPPLDFQENFRRLTEQIAASKVKQERSESEANNLFNSLLQRAFRGDL